METTKVFKRVPGRIKKFRSKYYQRNISAFARKNNAIEQAEGYNDFGIKTLIVPYKRKTGDTVYYVYVEKKFVDWINKKMVGNMRI